MTMQKLVSVALVLAAFALAGCNTVQGVGKDIEKAGEAIQKSAK
jgi:predicted small secreted protein